MNRIVAVTLLVFALALPGGVQAEQGLLGLYAKNRQEDVPNFITEDLVLTGFALVQRRAQWALESEVLVPLHERFIARLSERLAASRQGAHDDPATLANVAFIATVAALNRGQCDGLKGMAAEECSLAMAAAGISQSPIWGYQIDYSQLQPRGRYTQSERLGRYFRSVRYAATALFAIKPTAATGVDTERAERHAEQALALVRLIGADPELTELRATQERHMAWRFGRADDLTDADLRAILEQDEAPDAKAMLAYAKVHDRLPSIIGGVVDAGLLEEGVSAAEAMAGWRLLPSRYTAEAAAFQRLVYDGTGRYLGRKGEGDIPFGLALIDNQPVKGYPTAIELLALLGSAPARERLEARGEHRFEGYSAAFAEATETLSEEGGGRNGAYLAFMTNALAAPEPPGADRLNAMQAFWTWQRYLDLLYQKQSYTLTGKGMAMDAPRAGARLEPSTDLYRALAELVAVETDRGGAKAYWGQLDDLLTRLIEMSERVAAGQALSKADEQWLNDLDLEIEALAGGEDGPIVVDVHTNPAEGQVVEEALGWARAVQAGKARGARFTHYELKQPLANRLTDEAWIAQLREQTAQGDQDVVEP